MKIVVFFLISLILFIVSLGFYFYYSSKLEEIGSSHYVALTSFFLVFSCILALSTIAFLGPLLFYIALN